MKAATILVWFLLSLTCTTLAAAEPVRATQHARGDRGEVLIYSGSPNHIVVAMDTFAGGADGYVDQWFVLQTDVTQQAMRVHLPIADVRFREGRVLVISEQKRIVYEFAISDAWPDPTMAPGGYQIMRTEGYGLSHNVASTDVRVRPEKAKGLAVKAQDDCEFCDPLNPDWGGGEGSGSGTCDSGGIGSTSCSVTSGSYSCSVTCNIASYACCQITASGVNCKCRH